MGMGQMLMVIGALTLLSIITVSINSMFIQKTITMLEAEASINAISIAQSMIDEIKLKNKNYRCPGYTQGERCSGFDERTRTNPIFDSLQLTPPTLLGPDAGEIITMPDVSIPFRSVSVYDDVDDYHLYRRTVPTTFMGDFNVIDTIFYVNEINPEVRSGVQTYLKKIVVSVRHPNMVTMRCLQLSDVVVYRRDF